MIWWILGIIAYIAVIPFAYPKVKSETNSTFENYWFACIWPLMAIGWVLTGCKK